jgi:hypothetical protein
MSEQKQPFPEEPYNPLAEDKALGDLASELSETDSLRDIQDLSIAELFSVWLKSPKQTRRAFIDIIRPDSYGATRLIRVDTQAVISETSQFADDHTIIDRIRAMPLNQQWIRFGILLAALIIAFVGNSILQGGIGVRRTEENQLASGIPFLLLAMLVWLAAEFYGNWTTISQWLESIFSPSKDKLEDNSPQNIRDVSYSSLMPWYIRVHPLRLVFAFTGMIFTVITWFGTTDNTFDTLTFYIWLLSIFFWSITFAPQNFSFFDWATTWIERFRRFHWKNHVPVILAMTVILIAAAQFRFYDLANHPLEMTDDHVEKILDSGLIRDGYRPIFLANNGGREPMQMYLIAMVSHLPGFGINFDTIKFVSAVESLLTIPLLFWLGYELLEGESHRRRVIVGLLLAALVAVSYWHVAITRQGLRIPLTPLVVSLELIYLTRAIRRNTRADFIKAGLILGFGLYTYQAVRMLPVVIVMALAVAVIFVAKTMRERFLYILNLAILVIVSFTIFLPMFHYSMEFPDIFWRRTAGRLLGDDIIQETNSDGQLVYRDATVEERFQAFRNNMPTIVNNIRNVYLMFNWEGDVATISGVSNEPSMDVFSGVLLIVGISAWALFMLQRRDPIICLVPVIIFIMLLPSALSIAFPAENPSHTRTSGAIPLIFLIAAFPLALLAEQFLDLLQKWRGKIAAVALCVGIVFSSYNANNYLYFVVYRELYNNAFHPYSDAGRYLYGYILTGGSYGNAFLIGYEHWWSHRAIGLEGGLDEFWPNGVYPRENLAAFIHEAAGRTGRFRLNPDVELIFFYSPNDEETGAYLSELFPTGTATESPTRKPNETFMIYRVPALDEDDWATWLAEHPAR